MGYRLRRLFEIYPLLANKYPLFTACSTGGLILSAADVIAQTQLETAHELNRRRVLAMATFGFFYAGGFNFYLYRFFELAFPVARLGSRGSVFAKVVSDQFIHTPLLYLPAFYYSTGLMKGNRVSHISEQLKQEYWSSLTAAYKIWLPAQLVNFAIIPLEFRVLFVCSVSLAWNTILSFIANRRLHHESVVRHSATQ